MNDKNMQRSRVIVTGGSGMVAKFISRMLVENNNSIVSMPSRMELDLENKFEVIRYFKDFQPDYVYHLAGKVHGLGGNLLYPLETLSSNIQINDSVLSACSHKSVRKIFFAGTVASYAYPIEKLPLIEDQIFVGEPHDGEYGYAMAKRLAFSYLNLMKTKFNKQFVYGIYTNLYGPHDRFNIESGHVVPSLISKLYSSMKTSRKLHVWGRPETTRDFLFAEDAAAASIFLMNNADGIFNIASGREITMEQLVATLREVSGFSREVVWDDSKPIGIPRRYSDTTKLNSLGFFPGNDLSSGLRKTWTWYLNAMEKKQEIRK